MVLLTPFLLRSPPLVRAPAGGTVGLWAQPTLRARVREFLDQFAQGSQRLLEYVGLQGNGLLARMIHGP